MSPAVEAVHLRVEGRVQGVGFRDHTRRLAVDLGLAGFVRNLSDGGVEAMAEGPRERLEAFVAGVRRGPRLGRVERCRVSWASATGQFDGFSIRY